MRTSTGSWSLPRASPSRFRGRSESPHVRPASGGTVPWEGGWKEGACSKELGSGRSDPRLLSLAPYPHRAWCPASAGPSAHLFCALVTHESCPFLGPQSVWPQTLTGGPYQAPGTQRILLHWARHPWTGLRGGQGRQSPPLPLLTSTPIHAEPPRARAPSWLTPATVLGGAPAGGAFCHLDPRWHLGLGCNSLEKVVR